MSIPVSFHGSVKHLKSMDDKIPAPYHGAVGLLSFKGKKDEYGLCAGSGTVDQMLVLVGRPTCEIKMAFNPGCTASDSIEIPASSLMINHVGPII